MQIRVGERTHAARWIFPVDHNGETRLMMALTGAETIARIAQDLDGADIIEKTVEGRPGIIERFEGFNRLLIISRDNADGLTIVTMARG